MAILERRREIGIMKALGASDGDVKRIFFFEAGSMGIMGGALALAWAGRLGAFINFATNIYLQRQDIKPENFWVVPSGWWRPRWFLRVRKHVCGTVSGVAGSTARSGAVAA